MTLFFKIVRDGRDYYCSVNDAPKFFVGRRVEYDDNIGLYNIFAGTKVEKINFRSEDFEGEYGFWSMFVEPTALAEGRNFLTLNSYDAAGFTFGFGQFAAHVAEGDFVQYFRTMLRLPQAKDYFPNLGLVDGHIAKVDGRAPVKLEDGQSSGGLKKYLNPSPTEVEDSEIIAAAKFIHWTSTVAAARSLQVAQMVATFKDHVKDADGGAGLDGQTAACCCVVADILHQGRNRMTRGPLIREAFRSPAPLDKLLQIGLPKWKERLTTLGKAIKARPAMMARRWSRAAGDFV